VGNRFPKREGASGNNAAKTDETAHDKVDLREDWLKALNCGEAGG